MAIRGPIQLDLPATAARIDAAARIILTTHARADGDAIGSTGALRRVLRQRKKTVTTYLHEACPQRYQFLTQIEPVMTWDPATASDVLDQADLLVVVDTCARSQLGTVAEAIEKAQIHKLAIDHHRTHDDIVEEGCFDESACASAQLVTRLCDEAGWAMDTGTATLLFTGLATDMGWFRFPNADSAAFKTAAHLVEAGAQPHELYERLYLNHCAARTRLLGAMLSSFALHAGGRIASARLTRGMFRQCGATRDMTEDLINELQAINTVVASALFVEPLGEGPIRVSLRSKRDVDVAVLAQRWGGGGHARAAGARIEGTLDAVAEQVISALTRAVEGTS